MVAASFGGCSARAHVSIGDGIFEVASRILREAASAPITEISGLKVWLTG